MSKAPCAVPFPRRGADEARSLYDRSNLTRHQLLMWIGQRLHPHAPDFNMANLYLVDGPLDAALFARAVAALVEEVDALRTVVRDVDGIPFLDVRPRLSGEVRTYDLRDDRDAAVSMRALSRERAAVAFDLERRLCDFALFLLPQGRSAWYMNLHHMLGDGWAVTLLYERLSRLYGALEAACEPEPCLLKPFLDHLPVERAYVSSQAAQEDEAWWTARLRVGEPMQAYGEAVRGESGPASRVSIDLGLHRTARLREVSASLPGRFPHLVMQNLLAAALAAWLHRIGPNATLTIGLPSHNRTAASKAIVGLLMQVLPARVAIESDETLRSLYDKVSASAAQSLRHRRHTVDNPLHDRVCDVLVNYLAVADIGPFAGRPMQLEWVFSGHTNIALSVHIHDLRRTGTLHLDLDMQHGAFPESLRDDAAGHLLNLLDGALGDVDRPIDDIGVLSGHEQAVQVALGLGPAADIPEDPLAAFHERVRVAPHDQALRCGRERLTYLELEQRSNQLARHLARIGVGRNDQVAICLERGADMVVAVLAIMKAGAGYVPLDPSHPPLRLREILDDCRPARVVTHRRLLEALSVGLEAICLDREEVFEPDDSPLETDATPADLAYVIYTSGSSGRPKGVEIPRRALSNYLRAMQALGWVKAGERLLAVSPLAFDFHVPQLHLPLLQGATIVLARADEVADPRALLALIDEHDVTAMAATPTLFRMMIDAGWPGTPTLKVHCGGEALTPGLASELRPRVAELWNVYGPTETTVYSSLHRIEEEVSVGRPIANTWMRIVDARGRPLPRGVVGELLIGGAGLGRGYLHRPQLTVERFVDVEGGRAYRTGDLARWRPDGTLEIVGRSDHQVKIRGHRIELGEIEAVLERHPCVSRAVVAVQDDGKGDPRLVAWYMGEKATDLRDFVASRLPASMVPSTVVRLETLPLSSNGKIDRKALLPAPPLQPMPSTRSTDLLAYQLTCIMEEVLDVSGLSPSDSFFDHGGSSLLAVRILSRVEAVLGRSIPVQALMQAPSPERLAALLRADGWTPALETLVPLQPRGSSPPFFCVHAFIGDVCRALARRFTAGQPFYGLQPRGLDGREAPLRTVEEMASHYVSELRRCQPRGPYALGGYCFGGIVAFEMARQLRHDGENVRLLAIIDAAPRNVRRRSLRSRVNGVLRAAERLVDMLTSRQPARAVHRLLDRVRLRRGDIEAAALRDILPGLTEWPSAYQRMAAIHYQALLRYVPREYDGCVTLIRTSERGQRWSLEDESWGWDRLAARVDVKRVAGSHHEIMNDPHVREVADLLLEALARTDGSAETRTAADSPRPLQPAMPARRGGAEGPAPLSP